MGKNSGRFLRNGVVAVIPAAGAGRRMGQAQPKQFLKLGDRPLLAVTLQPFQDCPAVDAIFLVVPSGDLDRCRLDVVERYGLNKVEKVLAGGSRRRDSVRSGLEAANGLYEWVLVHDGARPFVKRELIEKMVAAGREYGAASVGVPAQDTLKEVDASLRVVRTLDRERVWAVQTPQVFRLDNLLRAHREAAHEAEEATDDAVLVERLGIPVTIVEGPKENIKVTTPHDLDLARFLLEKLSANS